MWSKTETKGWCRLVAVDGELLGQALDGDSVLENLGLELEGGSLNHGTA